MNKLSELVWIKENSSKMDFSSNDIEVIGGCRALDAVPSGAIWLAEIGRWTCKRWKKKQFRINTKKIEDLKEPKDGNFYDYGDHYFSGKVQSCSEKSPNGPILLIAEKFWKRCYWVFRIKQHHPLSSEVIFYSRLYPRHFPTWTQSIKASERHGCKSQKVTTWYQVNCKIIWNHWWSIFWLARFHMWLIRWIWDLISFSIISVPRPFNSISIFSEALPPKKFRPFSLISFSWIQAMMMSACPKLSPVALRSIKRIKNSNIFNSSLLLIFYILFYISYTSILNNAIVNISYH